MEIQSAGRPVYAYTGGRPFNAAAPTLVFVHGGANDHSVWALHSRYFAHHGFAVLAVDLPGHGRTAGPPLATIELLGQWLVEQLDTLGVERCAIAGHSMGSLIALESAARLGSRATGLALIGATFPMRVSPELLEAARSDEPLAHRMINAWAHAGYAQFPGNPGPGSWVRGANLRLMQRQRAGTLYTDFNACNNYAVGLQRAAEVRCPVLLILASADVMTSVAGGRALAKSFHDARVVEVAGSGHALMGEAPEEVLDALRSFLPRIT
jgi:pimeloyl-ACP methyl ester carboxylesterase